MRKNPIRIPVLLVASVLFLSACNISFASDVTPPPGYVPPTYEDVEFVLEDSYPLTVPDIANGEALYIENCADCHGLTGLGDGGLVGNLPNGAPAIGSPELGYELSPLYIYSMVTQGNMQNLMPPFTSLTDQERWDVAGFVVNLSADPDMIPMGEAIYQESCAECHGVDGSGDSATIDFTDSETMVQYSFYDMVGVIINGNEDMPAFPDYSEPELVSVLNYVRNLTVPLGASEDVFEESADAVETVQAEGDPSVEATVAPEAGAATEVAVAPDDATPENSDAAVEATAENTGLTFSGTVDNGSDAPLPDGVEVVLNGYDHMDQALTVTGTLDADGQYLFEDVEWAESRMYFVTIDYAGIQFASDFIVADDPAVTEFDLPLTIYETTTSTENLMSPRMHIFLEFPEDGVVQVIVMVTLTNTGEEAVVTIDDTTPTLRYEIPEGGYDLVFEDQSSGRFVPTETGFGDLRTIAPGDTSYQLLYAYSMPYDKELDFSYELAYPLESAGVFIPDVDLKTTGDFESLGLRDMGGFSFDVYESGSLAAGDTLEFTVKGKHPANATSNVLSSFSLGDNTNLILGGVAVLLALIVSFVWFRGEKDETTPDDIIHQIVLLDEAFDDGTIDENRYARERAVLKKKLQEMKGK